PPGYGGGVPGAAPAPGGGGPRPRPAGPWPGGGPGWGTPARGRGGGGGGGGRPPPPPPRVGRGGAGAAGRGGRPGAGGASAVAWPSLGREGVRFVNLALTREDIAGVTGVPVEAVKAPVRAFAGLASGPSVDVRVDLVMEDLDRLGAFERSVLCVASPTG